MLCEASDGVLDAIVRHYQALRLPVRLLLAEDFLGPRVRRLVERHGSRRAAGDALVTNLLRASRAPSPPRVPGVAVERVSRDELGPFVELARDAFGDRGFVREYFRRAQVALMRGHPRRAIGVRALGEGVFVSRHDEWNAASARNQRDVGFRPYYRATRWEREA